MIIGVICIILFLVGLLMVRLLKMCVPVVLILRRGGGLIRGGRVSLILFGRLFLRMRRRLIVRLSLIWLIGVRL